MQESPSICPKTGKENHYSRNSNGFWVVITGGSARCVAMGEKEKVNNVLAGLSAAEKKQFCEDVGKLKQRRANP